MRIVTHDTDNQTDSRSVVSRIWLQFGSERQLAAIVALSLQALVEPRAKDLIQSSLNKHSGTVWAYLI
jgi:hypothetical protein